MVRNRAEESKSFQMELSMKVIGSMVRRKDLEHILTQEERLTKASGLMIEKKALE